MLRALVLLLNLVVALAWAATASSSVREPRPAKQRR
jgi:hypothetical protein